MILDRKTPNLPPESHSERDSFAGKEFVYPPNEKSCQNFFGVELAFGQGEPAERVKLFRMIRVNSCLCPTVHILGIPMVEPQSQPDQTQG